MLRNGMWVLAASLGLTAVGCGGGGGGAASGGAQQPAQVAAQYQGAIQSSDVAHGEELYNSVCMSCHGGGAPALENIAWSPGAMRERIREGGGRMPAITADHLSDQDMEAVLAYMTTIGAVSGELPGGGGAEPASAGGAEPAAEGTDDAAAQ